MNFLIDADSAIYKAGCANEERRWMVGMDGQVLADFQYKADADQYMEGDELLECWLEKKAGPIEHSIANIKSLMEKITSHPQCKTFQVFISGKNNFRYDIDPNYKGNRDKNAKPIHEQQIRDYLKNKWNAIVIDDHEVDDEVSILCMDNPYENVIVSIDKDLDNTPGFHYNYDKDEMYYIEPETASLNFYRQMLSGDPTDNIKGVKGIGKKRAEELLPHSLTDERLCSIVWKVYQDKGHDFDYFLQQGRLLWMLQERDVMWDPPLEYEVDWDGEFKSYTTGAMDVA